jgi:hypothetical protein
MSNEVNWACGRDLYDITTRLKEINADSQQCWQMFESGERKRTTDENNSLADELRRELYAQTRQLVDEYAFLDKSPKQSRIKRVVVSKEKEN